MQTELFEVAFEELSANDDLINQVLEVTMTDRDEIHVLRYRLPQE